MVRAVDLLKQGRSEELWQMCCGYLKLSIDQFMSIQKRLLLEQIALLNQSTLGKKIMLGNPKTVEEFRNLVPLTTYHDYCPELPDKKEDTLPDKPAHWLHTSGKSGEYPCKWIPLSESFSHELSKIEYGVWLLSCGKDWGDISKLKVCPKIVYTVAPLPYTSGALAKIVMEQSPVDYLPSVKNLDELPFDARIKLGFEQALSEGFDCFFGLSLVLAMVGNKFSESLSSINVFPYFSRPKALSRLARGFIKSKIAGRPMLPKDLWKVKGIISSGLDSSVYKDKIEKMWGKYPLDIYSCTEAGIIATQTWDYDSMTFVPNLNFFEFIPEKEHFKWQIDHTYQPKTVLLDEVKAGEVYEIVITNFHGGSLLRYRIGDMVRITSLRNEKLGIDTPQMVFERRADDLLDFGVIRLSEKSIWNAIESAGIPYEDWVACKEPGEQVLDVYVELKNGNNSKVEKELPEILYRSLTVTENEVSKVVNEVDGYLNFEVKIHKLPQGAFTNYTAQRQKEGADLAHLKPPHINPSQKVLSLLLVQPRQVQPEIRKEAVPA
jgi:hypothetical protein